ncbi:SDR family NAD(P)-dependent oxidoreductase [Runella sp. MFBS21]|uniref:SDR family NAD(P)-dependent oxidoreductase n=1 Tax=Runella sp. MFBS21 TaxID=3034018 RepID=UPI0023F95109|nr:SDR family NAD(P)-dependent oxidoreductase [Runella sp. MFBS21]MDF7817430.1 SDR family NAD(P)-dependent oxidoreductase [Runella sp. MFBS21]
MSKRIIFITGSSRGIGKAVTVHFLTYSPQDLVVGTARTAPDESWAKANFIGIQEDLSDLEGCENTMKHWTQIVEDNATASLVFINNAGRLGEIEPSFHVPAADLAKTIFLNMTAPMILQNYLVSLAVAKNIPLEVVNISSGAAKHEYYGWSGYCSTKAGFLMASQVLALEISQLHHPVKVWNLAPGVVNTAMQDEIRSRTPEQFAEVERFKALYAEGKLRSPESVATFIDKALGNEKFQNGGFYDIRDLEH